MALDDAGVAFADGRARDVDLLAGLEHRHGELGPDLEVADLVRSHAEFTQLAAGFDAGLREMARGARDGSNERKER